MTNKRINIQFSIDLSELPDEVERLYSKALDEFNDIDFPQIEKSNMLNHTTALKADEIRQKIAKLDLILSDVQSIVSSYIEYDISNKKPQPDDLTQVPQMTNGPDLSNFDFSEMSKLFNGEINNELQEPDQRSE